MNFPWAISIAREDAPALARLRLRQGLEIGETEKQLWLRGKAVDEHLDRALMRLPATARYEWLSDDRLRRLESRISSATMPALDWAPLSEWIRTEVGAAALPARIPGGVRLEIVRSFDERPAELLLTQFSQWHRFVLEAPEVRLRPLSFAMNADGQVLVGGTPSPPLPGQPFVLWRSPSDSGSGGIALPAGFKWCPEVSVEVVLRRLGFPPDSLALCCARRDSSSHAVLTFTRIHTDQFVPASRSAVRATAKALQV
jgi:hypothetical protein